MTHTEPKTWENIFTNPAEATVFIIRISSIQSNNIRGVCEGCIIKLIYPIDVSREQEVNPLSLWKSWKDFSSVYLKTSFQSAQSIKPPRTLEDKCPGF